MGSKSMNKIITIFVIVLIGIVTVVVLYKIKSPRIDLSIKDSDAQLLKNHYKGVDCTQLAGETARPNNDIIESRIQLCAEERAWFENNPSFCRLHSNPDHCYSWMAIKLKDSKLCNESGVKRDNCIKLIETTKNEDTWHWDYIRRNQNPI